MSSSNGKRPGGAADEGGNRLARHGVALVDAHDGAALDGRCEDVHRDVGVGSGRAKPTMRYLHDKSREDEAELLADALRPACGALGLGQALQLLRELGPPAKAEGAGA